MTVNYVAVKKFTQFCQFHNSSFITAIFDTKLQKTIGILTA
ncbi:hypothetical protein NSP_29730 [Nodularia spumigena CCY9414]|nr:hypothetical protein NSP_29730 [Nodularia spumigena CCY9414]